MSISSFDMIVFGISLFSLGIAVSFLVMVLIERWLVRRRAISETIAHGESPCCVSSTRWSRFKAYVLHPKRILLMFCPVKYVPESDSITVLGRDISMDVLRFLAINLKNNSWFQLYCDGNGVICEKKDPRFKGRKVSLPMSPHTYTQTALGANQQGWQVEAATDRFPITYPGEYLNNQTAATTIGIGQAAVAGRLGNYNLGGVHHDNNYNQ